MVVQAVASAVLEEALVTVALAAPAVVLGMEAQAVASVVLEEVFLMVALVAHVEGLVAPVVGKEALGVVAAGGRDGAVVGMAAGVVAHGAGVTHIMVGAMEAHGATLTGAVAGAGEHHLCSAQCSV